MTTYVFDAEPLIAYLYVEPGSDDIERLLAEIDNDQATGAFSIVTATEVMYKIARIEAGGAPSAVELTLGEREVAILEQAGLNRLRAPWDLAAEVKAAGGISLGDSFAVALAADQDATLVVGGDPEFDDLALEVSVYQLREGSV